MSIVQLTAVIVTDPADTTASEAGVDPFTVGFCEGAVGGVLQAMLDSMVAAAITIHPKRVIVMPPTVGLLLNFVGERLLARQENLAAAIVTTGSRIGSSRSVS
jgi:hypothetical protein